MCTRGMRSHTSLFAILVMLLEYPCFGHHNLSSKEWWKLCVLRSFTLAGVPSMGPQQANHVFQRIYSLFGSHAVYERFDDAAPFLHWARRHGIVCGLLSNADERYGDSILPMLGLTLGEELLQFQLFSKDYGLEKPDAKFFGSMLEQASTTLPVGSQSLLPSQVLHIGNDYTKDFVGARRAGMHAILLDRYDETERAAEWQRRGAVVRNDLIDVVEFLGESRCRLGYDDEDPAKTKHDLS